MKEVSRRKFIGTSVAGVVGPLAVRKRFALSSAGSSALKPQYSPITIRIRLSIYRASGHEHLIEDVSYAGGTDGKFREAYMQSVWEEKKKARGKTYKLPPNDHERNTGHQPWIVREGDAVIWECDREFMLSVDYNWDPCDAIEGAPRNPFGWRGVQKGRQETPGSGPYRVIGIASGEPAADDQMFYKYSAFVENIEPLDPDGSTFHGP